MQIIPLTTEDDIVSACDRVEWATDTRILFTLPPKSDLNNKLDFIRLRRCADYNRVEVGLIVGDKKLRRQAKALGFPIFRDEEQAAQDGRRWRRGQRRRELVGLPTKGGQPLSEWRQEQQPEKAIAPAKTVVLTPRQWGVRYTAVFAFFIAAALIVVLFAYAVPSATITLAPELEPLNATQIVVADPLITAVNFANKTIPARQIAITQAWEAEVEATGTAERPITPAQGAVLLTNLTDEAVIVPDGTQIRTANRIFFETIAPVTLPAAEGSTTEVAVVAVEPGPHANVAANSVTRLVEKELARQIEVRNPERMTGGDVQEITAVSQSDLDQLRSQALQFLQAIALAQMDAELTEREFLARESLRLIEVVSEVYSHEVGEQANRVTLEMKAVLVGTAVNQTEAAGLAYDALAAEVVDGYSLSPDSLTFEPGPVIAVDEDGRVTFEVLVNGATAADLNVDGVITAVNGQNPDIAAAYLYNNLPLRDVPTITLWPIWADKMPYWQQRIELIMDNG